MHEAGVTGRGIWVPAGLGLLVLLAFLGLPVELAIGWTEHPVVAPPVAATVLHVGSCLLLVWSGLGLRRLEAARARAERPSPGA
jgi:hypothetical protein